MPLFFANATTAASLYVNCLSSIASILQFGLCGGTLIFVNFLLALCATPAILLLQEQHDELGEAVTGHQQNRERKKLLIACHQVLWDHRAAITASFGFLILMLTPFALSLRPGADATFTFAPDPAMMRIVSRAHLGPADDGHIFKSAERSSMSPLSALEVGEGGAKGDHAKVPTRLTALLNGTYVEPEQHSNVQGFVFAILFIGLQSGDAGLLTALAVALRCDGPFLLFQAPSGGNAPFVAIALIFSLGGLCAATSHLDTILSLTLCDFTREMRVFHGEYVGIAYLLHSAFFAYVSLVVRRGVSHGMIHVMDWMSEYRTLAVNFFAGLSVACLAIGVVVLILVNEQVQWPVEVIFTWTWRGPAGAALFTALVWLYDGFMLSLVASAAKCHEAVFHFRSRPEWFWGSQALSVLHSFMGWTLLLASGLPISRDLPYALAYDVLALWLLLNAIMHGSLLFALSHGTPSSCFQPTEWSQRNYFLALLIQFLMVTAFGLGALMAFVKAGNATMCDSDRNDHISLREIQICLDALLQSVLSVRLSSIFLGVLLAALWILDSLVCVVAANVVRTRRPYGCLGPMSRTTTGDVSQDDHRLLRRLRAASATFGLSGLAVLLLSFSPPAFGAAFGPQAILASNLLGFSLMLLHAPPLFVLALVFREGVAIHMLHPTEASRRSPLPAVAAVLAGGACFVAGLAILITQNSMPDLEWPKSSGIEAHGFVLSLVLLYDACCFLTLSGVQSGGKSCFIFRPLPTASVDERRQLADTFALCAGSVFFAALFACFVAMNHTFGDALFGSTRMLAVLLELTLAAHALGLYVMAYLFRRNLAVGVIESPPPHEAGTKGVSFLCPWLLLLPSRLCPSLDRLIEAYDAPLPSVLFRLAAVCAAMGLLLPLADGWFWWESLGVGCFALLVFGMVVTHGMYAGNVIVQVSRQDSTCVRRATFGLTTLFAFMLGVCFANAVAGHRLRMPYYAFVPLEYLLIVAVAAFALINFVPVAAAMEVRYTGIPLCGFSADDVPQERGRLPVAFALLAVAMVCAAVAGAAWTTAQGIVTLDEDAWKTDPPSVRVSLGAAERCNLYWGVNLADGAAAGASSAQDIDMADPAVQLELLAACSLLRRDDSPLHPDGRQSASWGCFMTSFRAWLVSNGRAFPVTPPHEFHRNVIEYLDSPYNWLRQEVGLTGGGDENGAANNSTGVAPRLAWMRVGAVPTKFAGGSGEEAMALLADPVLLLRHKAEWDVWLQNLPQLVRAHVPNTTTPLWKEGIYAGRDGNSAHQWTVPAAPESVLSGGTLTCAKWSLLATLLAFYRSASTALSVTPLVSMGAIALFTRSLIISYTALYCLAGMVITLLGLMKICGLSFGAVSALALALVLGMSVDYIIHIAHAFKNTLLPQRFHKSRATVLARATSIGSAAATTLASVSPLLFAQLLPLREFGQIFVLVTCISLCFSVAFLTCLMMAGPKMTRRQAVQEAEEMRRARRNQMTQPQLTEPHSVGDGWAMQLVDVVEPSGPRDDHTSERAGMAPQILNHDELETHFMSATRQQRNSDDIHDDIMDDDDADLVDEML